MSGVWTCPRNHRWRPSATDSTTLDAVQPCPVCGEPGTLADAGSADTPADDVTLSRGYAPRPVPAAEVHIPGYAVTAEIGRGAMGVVYRATETALNRPVALKMILAGAHAGGRDVARFRREVGAVAALRHPNIVQIYALGEAGGLPFCALELVEGGTLAERLKKQGPLDPRVAARLVADLARAVHFAHERGIVHRDLKPANVLLDGDGRPKIADFGLAKLGGDSSLTGSAAVLGTPAYMAPEQAGDGKAVGPAADVHGLGAILYELLTGRPPFKAGSALETLQQVLHDDAAPVRRARPDVPKDLETITLKCLEKDPGRRYASAAALADDLERFLAGEPVTARPLGGAARAVRWAGRHRPALVGAAAATAVTLLVVSLWPEPAGDAGHPHAGTGRETATTGAAEDAELVVRVGDRTGPGSLYFERGVVLTSTDLLGMAAKDSPPPARVEVVYHPGRPDERTYPAEVVSAEPAVKVAVLRLKGDRLPDPPPQPGVAVAAAPAQPATADSKLAVRSGSGAGGRKAGLEAAAAAVVQVRLTRDGKEATAPGFFAGPPGVVATAAVAPADAVTVAVHAGMPAERVLPARVLAVDHDAALAVLRVDGDDLPPPLPLAPSGRMREGQKLHAVAAPVAGRPAAIEPAALTGRIMSRNGGTRYLQVETAKVGPGTPVVDGAGRLVGVAHAVLGGTRLHFLTPADEVERLLDGRLLTVTPSQPVAADGGTTVPVTARLADPLGRVKAVALAVWAGDPTGVVKPATGAARPAEITAARIVGLRLAGDPNPLDGRLAEGDVPLPTMTLLQVAWVRPRYTAVDGKQWWGEGVSLGALPPPVRPEPAALRFRPERDGRVTVQFRVPVRAEGRIGPAPDWTAVMAEKVRPGDGGGAVRRLGYQDVRLMDRMASTLLREKMGEFLAALRRQAIVLDVAPDGAMRSARAEPGGDDADIGRMNAHVGDALAALAVPLPGREVRPGEAWDGEVKLRGGPTAAEVTWTTRYRYAGRRTRNGRDEAVIEFTGRPADAAVRGSALGAVVVDLGTGRAVLGRARFEGGSSAPVQVALARSDMADGPAPVVDFAALPADQPIHFTPTVR